MAKDGYNVDFGIKPEGGCSGLVRINGIVMKKEQAERLYFS